MAMSKILALSASFFCFIAFSGEQACNKDINTIPPSSPWMDGLLSVLRLPYDDKTRNFSMKINNKPVVLNYKIFSSSIKPSKGTIVYMCGGPGFPCMRDRTSSVPPDFNIVTMDYMGVGQNKKYTDPDLMQIESQGKAFAELIKLIPDKKVVIYGHSFGTTVATVAASILTKESQNSKVEGVLLEGIVGKGEYEKANEEYASVANDAWSLVSKKDKDGFFRMFNSLGKSDQTSLLQDIKLGLMSGSKVVAAFLSLISKMSKDELVEHIEKSNQHMKFLNDDMSFANYLAAGCQIFAKDMKGPSFIFDKKIKYPNEEAGKFICNCRTIEKTWNPNQFQISGVPVVYINGESDPATPISWAMEHYNSQKTETKIFLRIPRGGHMESMSSLSECMEPIFSNLFKNKEGLTFFEKNKWEIERGECEETNFDSKSTEGTK